MTDSYKYWAFISYSHQDKAWGDWLHKAIETYRVPGRLAGRASRDGVVPKRLFPIFRDREELPTSSDLGSNINQALHQSRYLIVICSPRSAVSRWVNEEIKAFKALGREDRILCLIVNGEPNASDQPHSGLLECFPEAVRFYVDLTGQVTSEHREPIAADARGGKDGKADARLKILAGLLGVGFDELKQRELIRRRRRSAVAALFGLLIVSMVYGAWRWQGQRYETQMSAEHQAERGRKTMAEGDVARALLHLMLAYEQGDHSPATRLMLARASERIEGVSTPVRGEGSAVATATRDGQVVATEVQGGRLRIWRASGILEIAGAGTPVSAFTLSDDGKVLVLAAAGVVSVWNAITGEKRHDAGRYQPGFADLIVSGTGDTFFVRDSSTLRAWDVTRATALPAQQWISVLGVIAFDSSGRHVLAVKRAGAGADLMEVRTGRVVRSFLPPAHADSQWFVVGGDMVAAGDSRGGKVHLWHGLTGRFWRTIDFGTALPAGVGSDPPVAWSFDLDRTRSKIVVGTGDGNVVFVNLKDNDAPVVSSYPHRGTVRQVRFSNDGTRVLSMNWNRTDEPGEIRLWDAGSGALLADLGGHAAGPWAMAWTNDDKQIITMDRAGTVRVRDAERAGLKPRLVPEGAYQQVSLKGDGTHAALQFKDGRVEVWTLPEWRKVSAWTGVSSETLVRTASSGNCLRFEDEAHALVLRAVSDGRVLVRAAKAQAISSDCKWVAILGESGVPALLRVADGKSFPISSPVRSDASSGDKSRQPDDVLFAFSGDGRSVAACRRKSCTVADLAHEPQFRSIPLQAEATAIGLSGDGLLLAVATEQDDGVIAIHRTSDGVRLHWGFGGPQHSLVFSVAGTQVLAVAKDGRVMALQMQKGKEYLETVELEKQDAWMLAAPVLTPDGSFIITGTSGLKQRVDGQWMLSPDRHLRIWDARSGKTLWSVPYELGVQQIATNTSGDMMFVVSGKRQIYRQEIKLERRTPTEVRAAVRAGKEFLQR